jgi:cathepsin H
MEAHYILKHSQAKNLSEQQLVDCAGAFNNFGCNGGLPSQAFEYLHYVGGHDTETIYPYTAKDGPCTYSGKGVAQVRAVNNITAFDEIELQEAVGTYGPVSIAYQVSSDFRNYKEGVYDGVCQDQPEDVNHAVVVVGYGKQTPGGKYWTLRNSWGETFGMDGYFKMARGKNKCGISDCASFPSVA